ncbi:MAG TPA: hypothetical protein VGQ99_03540 [Tepidisphaeraceae bacterium]|nr:hypothetical protein [Tepidisphaeraceae bacterium]
MAIVKAENVGGISRFTTFSHPGSLLIWLGLQLLVLLLPVMQVPLSEEFPRPGEKLAVEEMVVAQIALSALLLPVLMPSPAAVMVMAATTGPFLQLAGVLSSSPPYRLIEVSGFVSTWIIALGFLGAGPMRPRWKIWAAAATSEISIGGALAAYLLRDFGSGDMIGTGFGPIVSAIEVLYGMEDRWREWFFIFGFLIAVAVARLIAIRFARRSSRQVIHNFGG